jgi:hypothetical protein
MKYRFRLVKGYSGKRRFRLRKKPKNDENLLAKIISLARGGKWT